MPRMKCQLLFNRHFLCPMKHIKYFYRLQNYYGSLMENNWHNELSVMLQSEINLEKASNILKSFKESGVTQDQIRESLSLRREKSDEIVEDRILEVLDIVEGYCNPVYRVW